MDDAVRKLLEENDVKFTEIKQVIAVDIDA